MRLTTGVTALLLGAGLLAAACGGGGDQEPRHDGAADAAVEAGPSPDQGVHFPADEAPHSDPTEWWYYTGRLTTSAGEVFGFELTIFQTMIYHKPLYVGHFAITDVKGDAFHSAMEASGEDQRLAAKTGFALKVGGMQMQGGGGKDALKVSIKGGHGLELALSAEKPAVLQYGSGAMTIGSDQPFYYYSYSRMAASGTITINGVKQAVTGAAWMDHQWGTIGTGYGWDWFSLRLDDRTEVMLFAVRRTGKPGFVGGTTIDKAGQPTELKPGDFTTKALAQWTSPESGITYPHGWQIEVKPIGLKVDLTPVVADQEFRHNFMGSPIYWEGLCDLAGTRGGAAIKGHAYVEITGNWK